MRQLKGTARQNICIMHVKLYCSILNKETMQLEFASRSCYGWRVWLRLKLLFQSKNYSQSVKNGFVKYYFPVDRLHLQENCSIHPTLQSLNYIVKHWVTFNRQIILQKWTSFIMAAEKISFFLLLISLTSFIAMCKVQENVCFKLRLVSLLTYTQKNNKSATISFMKMVSRQMIPSQFICDVSHSSGVSLVTNWCCLLVVLMLPLIMQVTLP